MVDLMKYAYLLPKVQEPSSSYACMVTMNLQLAAG